MSPHPARSAPFAAARSMSAMSASFMRSARTRRHGVLVTTGACIATVALCATSATVARAVDPAVSNSLLFLPALPEARVAAMFGFDRDADPESWRPMAGVAELDVVDGCMTITANGSDPHIAGPRMQIDAATHHFLALRCRTNVLGTTEIYFGQSSSFVEGRRVSIEMEPGDEFVTYEVDLRDVPAWSGCVDSLRIDPVNGANESLARFELDWVAVYQAPPRLVPLLPRWIGTDALVLGFENRGGWPADAPVELHASGELLGSIERLETESSSTVVIDASRFAATTWIEASYRGRLVWRGRVVRPLSTLAEGLADDSGVDAGASLEIWGGAGVLRSAAGHRVRLFPVASVTLNGPGDARTYYEFDPRPIGSDAEGVLHREVVHDPLLGDVECCVRVRGTDVESWLESCADLEVARFEGPRLVDERPYSHALLPGLEYLEAGESSSNAAWTGTSYAARQRPPAFRVTAPTIAIEYDRVEGLAPRDTTQRAWVVSMTWTEAAVDASGVLRAPAIDFLTSDGAHASASVFLPAREVTDVSEDRFATQAQRLPSGERLSLSTSFAIERGTLEDVFARQWLPRTPKPPALGFVDPSEREERAPRPGAGTQDALEHVLATSMAAYTDTLFGGERTWKTHIAIQEEYSTNRPDMAATIVAESLRAGRPELLERTGFAPEASIEAILGSAASFVDAKSRDAATKAFAAMEPDGSVGYDATSETSRRIAAMTALHGVQGDLLGDRGVTNAGLIAERTAPLLEYAAYTRDPIYVSAALRALARINSFTVPRGAQTWEVHAQTPDLFAAALCARANLWGWRIQGDERFLDEAERWLKTGLPFLYWWKPARNDGVRAVHVANERGEGPVLTQRPPQPFYADPEREILPFASIAVFGTSWYSVPWFGIPVQWCGLAWANVVRELDAVRPLPAFVRVADGVFRSAANQQCDAGYLAGTIPDSWDLATNVSRQPYIVPRRLVEYAYRCLDVPGVDAIDYARLEHCAWTHVATRAILEHVEERADGIALSARSYAGQDASLVLGGPRVPVTSVRVGGIELTRGQGLGQYHQLHSGGDRTVLVVRWRASALDRIEIENDTGP